jgi:hypothetical protein
MSEFVFKTGGLIYLGVLLILIGYCLGLLTMGFLMEDKANSKSIGKWTINAEGYEGKWIHIRIDDMSAREALKTCQHEVGHEIFAEYCEYHIEDCLNLTEAK